VGGQVTRPAGRLGVGPPTTASLRRVLERAQSLAVGDLPREPFPAPAHDCASGPAVLPHGRGTGQAGRFLLALPGLVARMRKSPFPAALLLIATALSGCPLYESDDTACSSDGDCPRGFACALASGSCERAPEACEAPDDCGANETCSRAGICREGDCHYASVGCVDGYECSSSTGVWHCAPASEGLGGANGNAGAPNAGAGAGAVSAGGDGAAGAP
jgi:hypothetical protein